MNHILQAGQQQRQRIETAAEAVANLNPGATPEVVLVLGTGLGALVSEISDSVTIPYQEIPGFPTSTAPGHAGRLHIGQIGRARVLAFEGRFHLYEGWHMDDIVLPIRISCRLGVSSAIFSNSCGGMNPDLQKGDLLILDDHINLLGANPLTGANHDDWGPRFPDMSQPYCLESAARLSQIASQEQIRASRGVYVAVAGPNLETRAEYRMLHSLGADVVGMSTVPEAIICAHEGIRASAISVVTDLCDPDNLKKVSVEEILTVAAEAEPKLTRLVVNFLND
ncbi:MAG: purine-nucleoside phosphorylase [Planctomycetota bacterium]|nr:purine-nucleoside phosphorylase [Planctomycetota bacterium]